MVVRSRWTSAKPASRIRAPELVRGADDAVVAREHGRATRMVDAAVSA
jgi:hypothetical protein